MLFGFWRLLGLSLFDEARVAINMDISCRLLFVLNHLGKYTIYGVVVCKLY